MSQRQPHDEAVDSVTFTALAISGAGRPAFPFVRAWLLVGQKDEDDERPGRMSAFRSGQRSFGSM